ncbi:MAG: hypothetical protein JWQ07_4103 [Ramlibacter sp.]|nr:hypothetical protein [Ramlibacter sp.]
MDWFEKITGFRELPYDETQSKLSVENGCLCSTHSDNRFAVGTLETPTLGELRLQVAEMDLPPSRPRVSCIVGDARQLHGEPHFCRALFQVASQFNLLEMVGPSVTPEQGVAAYAQDRTQGPACAIAAGAGTIFRNYLVPLDGHLGQRRTRQIDCLADVGEALGNAGNRLWTMRNGYALCTGQGLERIDRLLEQMTDEQYDGVRSLLRVGLHWNVQVTDVGHGEHLVTQAYCSALPVAYSQAQQTRWTRFASLVLEAAYEATLLAGILNVIRGGSNIVLLTRLGGGAFGNDLTWVNGAIARAIRMMRHSALDIRIVCYGSVTQDLRDLVSELAT